MNLPIWRFLLPLSFQLLLVLAVPSRDIYTSLFGETVILQTVPVDPYDLLRGYSQTLSYEISQVRNLTSLPGWSELVRDRDNNYSAEFYLILESPEASDRVPPLPWQPIAISQNKPTNLASNQIAIQGKLSMSSRRSRIDYGVETYYLPEDRRQQINNEIRQLQQQRGQERPFVVEAKIDRWGNAVVVSLWLSDRRYRF